MFECSGPLGGSGEYQPQRATGPDCVALDARWELQRQISLHNAAHRFRPLSRSLPDLENVGAAEGEFFPVARVLEATLDERSPGKTWARGKGRMLPLRSGGGDD